MATSNKKFKVTYYSDDMELLNKMAFIAKQFDIKAEEYGEGGLMMSSAVTRNEDHADFEVNKSNNSKEEPDYLLQLVKEKYKQQ
ncbi:hypothetical protein SM873_001241 [Yersinia enterocolitica]|uniref:hypothetical protein n=1 Tax=Yersinia enterocolitica TaxID=630 RepID=UPI0028B3E0FF|nr:hypothetical protein [Yersinia enterocolitica]ELI7980069.1 hypothetical protein [Yersinia enterocolitica]ELW7369897.1 hypothetical protein [Yersinia enterocolitica]ELY5183131.1 hypothetical protein [Yersinia enterocolitica]ELY5235490.1 hypothetical protein [Yersinia enterocolitica]